jgi:hypothetical protein
MEEEYTYPPNRTYQKYKIVENNIKIKISEIVEANGDYNMYKIAMLCHDLKHNKFSLKKGAVCHGCRKTYKQGYAIYTYHDNVYLCSKCSIAINAKFLTKKPKKNGKGDLFYFDAHNPNQQYTSWILKLATLKAIEPIDSCYIRLHIVAYKTISEFLGDPLTLNDKLGGCQRTVYVGTHCRFCARKIDCYWGICDSCHKMRDKLLKSRVWIFMYNEYGFPLDVTKYILELLMNRHNSFKQPPPCVIEDTFT